MSKQTRNIYIPDHIHRAAVARSKELHLDLSTYINKMIIVECKLPITYNGRAGNMGVATHRGERKDGQE